MDDCCVEVVAVEFCVGVSVNDTFWDLLNDVSQHPVIMKRIPNTMITAPTK